MDIVGRCEGAQYAYWTTKQPTGLAVIRLRTYRLYRNLQRAGLAQRENVARLSKPGTLYMLLLLFYPRHQLNQAALRN